MSVDDQNSRKSNQSFYKTPEERDVMDDFTLNEQTVKVILTPHELAAMGGSFPFVRVVYREIHGEPIKEIQELYRHDALGRVIRNDDVAGWSWTGLPIPQDCIARCLNPWKEHSHRLVFLEIDGFVTESGNVLCSECNEMQENKLKWKKWLLGGLLYNPKEF